MLQGSRREESPCSGHHQLVERGSQGHAVFCFCSRCRRCCRLSLARPGIGGHAGLFSNAQDLAKLMQMYLQNGNYGGIDYLDSATIGAFSKCQFCADDNRRGAGFDKPQLSGPGPACDCVSKRSFGHTGFTGTIAWADPEEDIVYIFLSNRTWSDAENRKLIRMNTRSLIQEYIYDALNTYNTDETLSISHP